MLDIGWGELLVIGLVALIVVGPKDLPGLFRTAGQFMGKARGMAREFQRSMEAAADETGLKEASNSLKGIERLNLNSATGSARKYAETLVKGGDAAAPPKSPQPAAPPPAATPKAAAMPTSAATPQVTGTPQAAAAPPSSAPAEPAPADAPPPARDAAP